MEKMVLAKNDKGATAVLVAICMFVFLALAAFAIDIGHLVVTKNELQNSADAGALAGAADLYIPNGAGSIMVNVAADQTARDAATANKSDNVLLQNVDIDVRRGHWSIAGQLFTPNNNTQLPSINGVVDIDTVPGFVNAVEVISNRRSLPIASFFARVFGINQFSQSARAIGYIGPVGTIREREADFPIAICSQAIRGWGGGGAYDCGIGRLINSGNNSVTHNTGGWTDFNQVDPCQGGTNANIMKSLANQACSGGGLNPRPVVFGQDIATSGGEIQKVLDTLAACFRGRNTPWKITVPVIECNQNNVTNCARMVGAITIDILLINDEQNDKDFSNVPNAMSGWANPAPGTLAGWESFRSRFNLKYIDGNGAESLAQYLGKTIYFHPDCEGTSAAGLTGGLFFGVLAKTPVLVN